MTGYLSTNTYSALPDKTWVTLHNAIANATDPARIAQLAANQAAWLQSTNRAGTILDSNSWDGLTDLIEFRTPDERVITIPVPCAREAAAGFTEQYGLPVTRRGDSYRVLMAEWPTAHAANGRTHPSA